MKQFINFLLLTFLSGFLFSVNGQKTIRDKEGNTYKTIKAGNQVWMAENLKSIRFSNGDKITVIKEDVQWKDLTTPACCDFNNDPDYTKKYGRIYNWYTAADKRNVCPVGWHVPSDKEWVELSTFLSGEKGAGGVVFPAMVTLNKEVFSLLPEGLRGFDGGFTGLGYGGGGWWSITACTEKTGFYFGINYNTVGKQPLEGRKSFGYNIRCIKD
jgi:uncharacterized protein (TIGR02145 family)